MQSLLMIDLHCHTNCSDGSLSPEALLAKASEQKLSYLSVTDHDTMAAYPQLQALAPQYKVGIIPGIELSVNWKKQPLHILTYQVKPEPEFVSLLERQAATRTLRAQQIGLALAACGVKDAYEKAIAIAGHTRVARPHFAQVLVNEGKVADLQEAFKRYLKRGRPAYVACEWVKMEELIPLVSRLGGQTVLAHPTRYKLSASKLQELIKSFKVVGGLGLEVVSGAMHPKEIHSLAMLCQRFDLLASSGSDYHSDTHSRVSLGMQAKLPETCVPIWRSWGIE